MGALNKIAEEHWKRQMQQEHKEEELVSDLHTYATKSIHVATGVHSLLQALHMPAHLYYVSFKIKFYILYFF